MRLAVWPVAPARALAAALADVASEVVEVEPHEARAALDAGRVDLALVPTLDVLRRYDGIEVAPGVGLVGERSPRRRLVARAALDAIATVGFDPRDAQEAILMQLGLREHYGLFPTFGLADLGAPLADTLSAHDAVLAPLGPDTPEGTYALDPAQEWTDLTLRPFVWGLLAAPAGTLSPEAAARIQAAVQAAPPADALFVDGVGAFQLTLDGYALEGLSQWAEMLFETGTLAEIPPVPFAELPPADDDEADESQTEEGA